MAARSRNDPVKKKRLGKTLRKMKTTAILLVFEVGLCDDGKKS